MAHFRKKLQNHIYKIMRIFNVNNNNQRMICFLLVCQDGQFMHEVVVNGGIQHLLKIENRYILKGLIAKYSKNIEKCLNKEKLYLLLQMTGCSNASEKWTKRELAEKVKKQFGFLKEKEEAPVQENGNDKVFFDLRRIRAHMFLFLLAVQDQSVFSVEHRLIKYSDWKDLYNLDEAKAIINHYHENFAKLTRDQLKALLYISGHSCIDLNLNKEEYQKIILKSFHWPENINAASINSEFKKFFGFGGREYLGELKDDKPSGMGEMIWANGDKYVGHFRDGKMNGYGKFYYSNGDSYKGFWKNGSKFSSGCFFFENGDKAEGEWKNDVLCGYGFKLFSNGNSYRGKFKNGKFHGIGTFEWANGDKYEGYWRDGKMNGKGIKTFSNGDKFKGIFQNGKENCLNCTYTCANGDTFKGRYRNGCRHGQGVSIKKGNNFNEKWNAGNLEISCKAIAG
jgi:hypothetical protein